MEQEQEQEHSAKPDDVDKDGHYKAYEEYAKNLRAWFIAYGVGGPVLLLTQAAVSERIEESGQARAIVCGFLLGVALQVLLSLVNKYNNWVVYCHSKPRALKKGRAYRVAAYVSNMIWFDATLDLITVIAFGYSTVKVLLLFTGA